MRRIYLLLCAALLALSSQARELTFYIGDTEIKNGETVNFTDIKLTDAGGYYDVVMAPDLYIASDIFTANLNITATCTSGQQIQMCAGGSCKMGEVVEKKGIAIQAKTKLSLQFEYVGELDYDEEVPTVTATIEAQDGKYENTYKSYTIVMGPTASITVIENNRQIRFTEAGLEYSLDAPASFVLYDMAGHTIHSADLSGAGTIALEGLRSGVYVYSLNGKSFKIFKK